jgi:hypothetical protein
MGSMHTGLPSGGSPRESRESSTGARPSQDAGEEFLNALRERGVLLWLSAGQLRYKAPPGALTEVDLAALRSARREIIALLERPTAEGRGSTIFRAPLAFSQLWHWHMFQRSLQAGLRTVAHATRLRGSLDIATLRAAISDIVRRHDALRTRVVQVGETLFQEVHPFDGKFEFEVDALTEDTRESDRQAWLAAQIEAYVLRPIDLTMGPLFGAKLLRLGAREHVLLIAMDHMISDAVSLGLIVRDIFMGYEKVGSDGPTSLEPVNVGFRDYSIWQHAMRQHWADLHGRFWAERLSNCESSRFPIIQGVTAERKGGISAVPVTIARAQKEALKEWCKRRKTTLVLGVLTAYVSLVMQWCKSDDVMIQYQTSGRNSEEIDNSVGYFAALLGLRIRAVRGATFVDLLAEIEQEYCRTYERGDLSYMAFQLSRRAFARNTVFNWVPQSPKSALPDTDALTKPFTPSEVPIDNAALERFTWDDDPHIVLFETDHEVSGHVYFPKGRFARHEMEAFVHTFTCVLRRMLVFPDSVVLQDQRGLKAILTG